MVASRLRQARLARFVDRGEELSKFQAFIRSEEMTLFWVSGESGLGKSSFLTKLLVEAIPRDLIVVELSGSNARQADPVDLMTSIANQVTSYKFEGFHHALAEAQPDRLRLDIRSTGETVVAAGSEFNQSQIGTIAGTNIENINVNITPNVASRLARDDLSRITDAFMIDLAEAFSTPGVISIDAAERLPTRCHDWLMTELIPIAIDRIQQLRILVCSQREPSLDDVLQPFVCACRLRPVGLEIVREYLKFYDIEKDVVEGAARAIFVSSQGNMLAVATYARQLAAFQQETGPGKQRY